MKKFQRLFCILALLCSAFAQAADPFSVPDWQEPNVVAAMTEMWTAQSYGDSHTESVFIVHSRTRDGVPIIRKADDQHESAKEHFKLQAGDTAVFHTHPNSLGGRPSSADTTIADRFGVDMYVLSKDGLWFYSPQTKHLTLVMGWVITMHAGPNVPNCIDVSNASGKCETQVSVRTLAAV